MDKTGRNVPKVRFPGFTDDWEQRKLSETLSLENGFAFQSDFFVKEKTGIVVATPGNVSIDGGFICEGGKNYSVVGPCPDKFVFRPGDIFVTMTDLTPSANTLGKPAIVPDNGITYLHNQRLGKLVNFEGNKEFLFALLCTENYHTQMVKTASGTTVRHSSPERILSYETSLPKIEEQVLIGEFFANLDNLITLHQRELANLERQKKAVMKKIFSQDVRFKRADGTDFPEWEDSTIEETCDCLDNMRKPITKSDRESGPYPYYGSTNIQDYVAGYLFDEPLVLLAEDAGPFMEFWEKPIAQWAEGKFWVNNHAHVLRPHENRKFMFYQLEHKDIREFINNPGRGKLNQEDMRKIVVGIPCLEEQRLIADFLSDFDEAIAAAKKELELWKELKRGLLQQMFV